MRQCGSKSTFFTMKRLEGGVENLGRMGFENNGNNCSHLQYLKIFCLMVFLRQESIYSQIWKISDPVNKLVRNWYRVLMKKYFWKTSIGRDSFKIWTSRCLDPLEDVIHESHWLHRHCGKYSTSRDDHLTNVN